MAVEWSDVSGYEGYYQVSTEGNIRSLDRIVPLKSRSGNMTCKTYHGRSLATQLNNKGYVLVHLYKNDKRKCHTVHRVVASAFLPNPLDLPEVNHKDGVKGNNSVSNLEWSTVSANRKHAYDSGLQPIKVFSNETRANQHS